MIIICLIPNVKSAYLSYSNCQKCLSPQKIPALADYMVVLELCCSFLKVTKPATINLELYTFITSPKCVALLALYFWKTQFSSL